MGSTGGAYYSFLLRLWQVPAEGAQIWRVQIENILTGEKRGFTGIEELLSFINQVVSQENKISGEGS